MAHIGRTQTNDCANPVLDLYTPVGGVLTDAFSLEFQVFDISTPALELAPMQVFPTPPTRQTVNVGLSCPAGGAGKLGTGHYVASGWTVGGGENLGKHKIRWFYKQLSTSAERVLEEEFCVVDAPVSLSTGYAFVHDFRDQGIAAATASDSKLLQIIQRATRFIDKACNRFFEPRGMLATVDGSGTPALFLDMPIVALASVLEDNMSVDLVNEAKVYNRHLTEGLTTPDDRDNPKLEFISIVGLLGTSIRANMDRRYWRPAQQNILLDGVFGYTEPDLFSLVGVTPDLIRRVCIMLGLRDVAPIGSDDAITASVQARLISERTRDQSYQLGRGRIDLMGGSGGATPWTDDPEINTILDMYRAPPVVRTTGPWR